MGRSVTSHGPRKAKIFIVGEAPGMHEEIEGKPFAGSSGRLLNTLLMKVGLVREECRMGNIMQTRPKADNFDHFYLDRMRRLPSDDLVTATKRIKNEIIECNPNIVLALGNEPLRAFTGNTGISNWRGSVLWCNGIGCKVLPTFHPANLLRAWDNIPLSMFDFKRLREESKTSDYILRKREFLLGPSFEQVTQYLLEIGMAKNKVSFDVETDFDNHITAFAVAKSPWDVMSIPFTVGDGIPYWTEEEEVVIWKNLKTLMEDGDVEKIAQNAQFDIIIAAVNPYHMNVKGLVMDTMCGFHTVYPELASSEKMKWDKEAKSRISTGGGKTLAIISSIYTKEPYYKHWGHSGNDMQFWKYNAMDAAVTYEAAEGIEEELKEFGVWDFYNKFVHPLIPILIKTQMRGVRVDEKARLKTLEEYEKECVELQEKLDKVIGRAVNVNSPKQLQQLLYVDMNLPTKYKRKTGKVTTDERALDELSHKYPSPIFDLILGIRHDRKIISTYLQDKGGEDGRIRCSYVIGGTETGRLSSRTSVFGTGGNLQNVPSGACRRMFIPDDKKVFIHPDLSQAEARIVAYLANAQGLIHLFESGGDIHYEGGARLFSKRVEDITDKERNLAKRAIHASHYGIGYKAFAYHAGIGVNEGKLILNKYFDLYPEIKMWQLGVQSALGKDRVMVTPLGRKRRFFGRWGDTLFREAYAFVPQSTVADLLNLAIIKLDAKLGNRFELMLQEHDAFTIQVPINESPTIWIADIEEAFNIPLFIGGREFKIPVEIKIGNNWGDLVVYGKTA